MSLTDVSEKSSLSAVSLLSRHQAAVFSSTIFLSAFLLFGVQPMFTKMVLPWLGGSPGVWSVAMVFFQGLLLLGYLYAHLSTTYLKPKTGVILHAILSVAAFLTLPLAVSQSFGAPPETGQGIWLLLVFGVSVGLPFFVLSATAPLLQAWFARTTDHRADNPYFLYIASNTGSFAALVAYPLLIEPLATLEVQKTGWMWLFAVLGAALVICGLTANRMLKEISASHAVDKTPQPALTWRQRAMWTGLASVPSGLLVAVTAHLSTDVASAPLLWVVPLALFMLTFILAFKEKMFVSYAAMARIYVWFLACVIVSFVGFKVSLGFQFIVHLGVLFLAAMLCHRQLYITRPVSSQLTEFYLWMSFGGMLGGLFAGLLSPLLFDTILEYRLLLIATLLCVPAASQALPQKQQYLFFAFCLFVGAGLVLLSPFFITFDENSPKRIGMAAAVGFLLIIIMNKSGPIANTGAGCGAFLAIASITGATADISIRSFYGVNYVKYLDDGQLRVLRHGSTLHGAVRIKDLEGKPLSGRPQATMYYHDKGAINLALVEARRLAGGTLGNVAVLGLGAGALACQSAPRENWVFFEIDHEVAKLARNAEIFPFLSRCTPDARVVIGDARLTLQKQEKRFDVIILDAFSSDSVPAHLLTKEAFAIYARYLNPEGIIIAHVSNRYMDIRSVAEAAAQANGMEAASLYVPVDMTQPEARMQFAAPTVAVAISPSASILQDLVKQGKWVEAKPDAKHSLWTDDYANIVGAIIREKLQSSR